ncbi:uncharacterized protein PHALS_00312 [Plasmopara halstedii]|uniref:Uncharacterized protein n=1 Tax=Plasmopara halstedii TaxID=4781 RepID=A0A0P1A5Z9_PLAHL|nr:uncharacterized protein PHALS_00312 [Plasmopara halstedii]CEG35990.1 hypothetical protein PHALS_00312 [Plasmopara halstedii]|eukprot:XP_024572359.1 hypothetical protein PHALS_00312 [Plasmopara halstedii]
MLFLLFDQSRHDRTAEIDTSRFYASFNFTIVWVALILTDARRQKDDQLQGTTETMLSLKQSNKYLIGS